MSQNFKTALKYYFWLLVGIVLISFQVYKYIANTLIFDFKEAIILFVGMMFMVKPNAIPDMILKFFGKK